MKVMLGPKFPILPTDSVIDVTDQRVTKMSQVTAYLMKTPGSGACLDQTVAADDGQPLVGCHRGNPFSFGAFRDGVVNHPLLWRNPPDEGDIRLLHAPLLELPGEGPRRLRGHRKDQRSACGSVKTMYGINPLPNAISGDRHRHDRIAGPAAMRQEAGGFVHDHQSVISIEDVELSRELWK